MKKSPFLCFIHIEKSGGITLHNVFHRCFPGYISPHPDIKFGDPCTNVHLGQLIKKYPLQVTGIGGHRMGAFLNYESVVKSGICYFTLMRNPIERYMSHLNWQKFVMRKNWTPESFFSDPSAYNYQALRIAGTRDIDKAKKIMKEKFSLIGMIEKYDEAMVLLKGVIGDSSLDFRYEKANIKSYVEKAYRFDQLSPNLQEKAIANNKIDIELYRFLQEELYPIYLNRFQGNLDTEVNEFRESNKHYRHPKWALVKRKISNVILSKWIQPRISNALAKSENGLTDN
jgi:hypothetical protein